MEPVNNTPVGKPRIPITTPTRCTAPPRPRLPSRRRYMPPAAPPRRRRSRRSRTYPPPRPSAPPRRPGTHPRPPGRRARPPRHSGYRDFPIIIEVMAMFGMISMQNSYYNPYQMYRAAQAQAPQWSRRSTAPPSTPPRTPPPPPGPPTGTPAARSTASAPA